jgi:methionyl-tRNA formyltransferase
MKILFWGTSDFGLPSLDALNQGEDQVVAGITQPDSPSGRGLKLQLSPIKKYCLENNISIIQPVKLKDGSIVDEIKKYDADIAVLAAYGKILPKEILDIPKLGFINIHASLLPKYRGASPIHRAIVDGEEETGVSIIRMTPELDAGDILLQQGIKIDIDDTTESMSAKLAKLGAELTLKALDQIKTGKAKNLKQDNSKATYAPQLKKCDGQINWKADAKSIHNFIRGMNPWPGAFIMVKGKRVKILKSEILEEKLKILLVQPEGKKVMSYEEYIRGYGEII